MIAFFVLIAQVLAHQFDFVHGGELSLDHLACEQRIIFSGHAASCQSFVGGARERPARLDLRRKVNAQHPTGNADDAPHPSPRLRDGLGDYTPGTERKSRRLFK
ncbi:MAG: hypothetical protein AMXMBFR22_25580 [Phycisphaerae bacterium]